MRAKRYLIITIVVACAGWGCGGSDLDPGWVTPTPTAPPNAPPSVQQLTARAALEEATFTWTGVGGAVDYVLYVSDAPGVDPATAPVQAAVTGLGTTLPLDSGGDWYAVVTARSGDGVESSPSGEVSVSPLAVGTGGVLPLTTPQWTRGGSQSQRNFGADADGADVNGDGFADLVVGEPGVNANGGRVRVFYGGPDGLPTMTSWSTSGGAIDELGFAVGVADVNGDQIADILGAAPFAEITPGGAEGEAYAWHGSAAGPSMTTDWNASGSGTVDAQFGFRIENAGDVNNDGFDDVIVGAPLDEGLQVDEGRVYIYLGGANGLDTNYIFRADSDMPNAQMGDAVGGGGDVNGDGFGDVIIGFEEDAASRGSAWIFYGSAAGPDDNAIGWSYTGTNSGEQFGESVSIAGDINGDGYDDVLVGAEHFSADKGRVYLFFGSSNGPSTTPDWMYDGDTAGGRFGRNSAIVGDLNSDGYDDFAVCAPLRPTPDGEGRTYLFLGGPGGPAPAPTWMVDGQDTLSDLDFSERPLPAGDINGDGSLDLVLAMPDNDFGGATSSGEVQVFLGPPSDGPGVVLGDLKGSAVTASNAAFTDGTSGPFVCTLSWGDGTADVVLDPCDPADLATETHTFASGDYVAHLRVTNAYGLAGEAVTSVSIP